MLMKSAKQSSDTLVHAVVAPELEGIGAKYLENSQITTPGAFSRDLANQAEMWKKSCELCGISNFF